MLVTREIQAAIPADIQRIVDEAAAMRADIWRRYGALGTIGKKAQKLSTEIRRDGLYKDIDCGYASIRNETILDVVNDILLYKAAAKEKTRKDIHKRFGKNFSKPSYIKLKADKWLDDKFLHRRMRKHFRHGISKSNNQFVVRNDGFYSEIEDGLLVVYIKQVTHRNDIRLETTTSGKNVKIQGRNLRIIVEQNHVRICYAFDKTKNARPCGTQQIGVDKGYTEALVTSDAKFYGEPTKSKTGFGQLMTKETDRRSRVGKSRNKLYALAKKYEEQGKQSTAQNIRRNNLGKIKQTLKNTKLKAHLRDIAYKSVHDIVDRAELVVSEDLTWKPKGKNKRKCKWKKFNNRMSSWAKSVLAEALEAVCLQRGAHHALVNAAYTSQMDSMTGLLEGKRVGDKFYRETGDVMHADVNAANNVLARYFDDKITRFMSHENVKEILQARKEKPAEQTVTGISCSPSAINDVRITQ